MSASENAAPYAGHMLVALARPFKVVAAASGRVIMEQRLS
jgi:hypothetical protein